MRTMLWRSFLGMSVVIFLNLGVSAAPDEMSLFFKANEAYRQGDYAKAARIYERILQSGKTSGNLYYNLGNGYFKSGRLGSAVLSYERARRLMARDADLIANEQFARSQVEASPEPKASFFKMRFFDYCAYLTTDEWTIFVFVLGLATVIAHLLSLQQNWSVRQSRFWAGLFFLIWISHAGILVFKVNQQKDQAIILQKTDAFFEPRIKATIHFSLSEGTKVKSLKVEPPWVKIERSDGKMGWVQADTLEKI